MDPIQPGVLNIASAATLSNVASSATSVTLLSANTARRGLLVVNDSDKAMYVKYGTTASATSFTAKIAIGGSWEMPEPIFQGRIDAIWDTGPTGSARVTELT